MESLIIGLGAAVVVVALVDLVWTTMSLQHSGPVTRNLSQMLWWWFRQAGRRVGRRRVLPAAGPVILFATLTGWALMLWLGWFLVFWPDPQAVLVAADRAPAGPWERMYFAGFTISTLGIGDLVPGGPVWQVLTAFAGLTGLITITVGITYVVAVLSAIVQMRQLAAHITCLGDRPEAVLRRGWDGEGFAPLLEQLRSLTPQLLLTVHQQSAYPILHYYWSSVPQKALGPAIALLDESVMLLAHGVTPPHRPSPMTLSPLVGGVESLLDNLQPYYALHPKPDPPPPPDLASLGEAGIPVLSERDFAAALDRQDDRRRLLAALLRHEGWQWRPLERV